MGAFVAILNHTLLNIALPVMIVDMGITANAAQSLTTIFMLVNGILIPITAFLMEKFSTRHLFLTVIPLFALGTLICDISFSFPSLLAGLVVQAAGAGIMMPLLMNVILNLFPIEKRGSAMGMIGLAMMFAPAIGPTLSGLIVQSFSLRVLFFIVLPIAIIDIILAYFRLRNVTKLSNPKVDYKSIILSTNHRGNFWPSWRAAIGISWPWAYGWDKILLYDVRLYDANDWYIHDHDADYDCGTEPIAKTLVFTRNSDGQYIAPDVRLHRYRISGNSYEQQLVNIENLATIEGINDSFMVATVFAIVGFILSFFIKKTKPVEEDEEYYRQATHKKEQNMHVTRKVGYENR